MNSVQFATVLLPSNLYAYLESVTMKVGYEYASNLSQISLEIEGLSNAKTTHVDEF